jgi:hypothetical protein
MAVETLLALQRWIDLGRASIECVQRGQRDELPTPCLLHLSEDGRQAGQRVALVDVLQLFATEAQVMHSTPAHKQTDPAQRPGQIINRPEHEAMVDDMSDHAVQQRRFGSIETHEGNAKSFTEVMGATYGGHDVVGLNVPWHSITAEEKQAVLDGQAFCARIDQPTSAMYKPVHGGYPSLELREERAGHQHTAHCPSSCWKPGRDMPQGWDHV